MSHSDQSFLLELLSEDSVLRKNVTQQEVVLLLLCGNKRRLFIHVTILAEAPSVSVCQWTHQRGQWSLSWSRYRILWPAAPRIGPSSSSCTWRTTGESFSFPALRREQLTSEHACFILSEVCDESDVSDDQLVLQQEVFEEDIFLLQRDGIRTEQAHQQLCTGSTGTIIWLLWKAQWLQYTVLTWEDTHTSYCRVVILYLKSLYTLMLPTSPSVVSSTD